MLQFKIPEILSNCNSMQKRLKGSQKVEHRDFNNRRFEEDNPFYIGLKNNKQIVNKYEEVDGE